MTTNEYEKITEPFGCMGGIYTDDEYLYVKYDAGPMMMLKRGTRECEFVIQMAYDEAKTYGDQLYLDDYEEGVEYE